MTGDPGPDKEDIHTRAHLLPEEQATGSDDPEAQAKVILEDSLSRTDDPAGAEGEHLEHRRSEDTV
jgi:hypothetical protein